MADKKESGKYNLQLVKTFSYNNGNGLYAYGNIIYMYDCKQMIISRLSLKKDGESTSLDYKLPGITDNKIQNLLHAPIPFEVLSEDVFLLGYGVMSKNRGNYKIVNIKTSQIVKEISLSDYSFSYIAANNKYLIFNNHPKKMLYIYDIEKMNIVTKINIKHRCGQCKIVDNILCILSHDERLVYKYNLPDLKLLSTINLESYDSINMNKYEIPFRRGDDIFFYNFDGKVNAVNKNSLFLCGLVTPDYVCNESSVKKVDIYMRIE